jgi:hypothetical protein
MPATVWMQATEVKQATTITPATSNIKDDDNIMTAHNNRKASNRNESSNRTANTVWIPPKAGMLAKTVKPAITLREANSSRDNRNITASTAEGRPITTRMLEIIETSQQQYLHQQGRRQHNIDANSAILTPIARYGRQQRNKDANGTIWTPTAPYGRQQLISFRGNSPKSRQNGEKFVKKDVKKSKNSLFFV